MLKKNCPVCDHTNTEIRCELDSTNKDNFVEFSNIKFGGYLEEIVKKGLHTVIYGCNNCKFCWYNEIPTHDQLMTMYSKGQCTVNQTDEYNKVKDKHNRYILKGLLRIIKKNNNIKLLDYGSGIGRFSKLASSLGIEVSSFEPSLSRNQLKSIKNINYINDLKLLDESNIKFDAIILDNVLEHLPDPKDKMLEIRKYCDNNTLIYISVPNILRAHEGKEIWNVWPYKNKRVHTMAPYEHLSGFTPKSLDILLSNCSYTNTSFLNNLIFSPTIFIKKIILNLFRLGGSTMRIVKIKQA